MCACFLVEDGNSAASKKHKNTVGIAFTTREKDVGERESCFYNYSESCRARCFNRERDRWILILKE